MSFINIHLYHLSKYLILSSTEREHIKHVCKGMRVRKLYKNAVHFESTIPLSILNI